MPISGHETAGLISEALEIARGTGSYEKFREEYYDKYLRTILCDSRETIPAVFAILLFSKGDPKQSIIWDANFGRDSDKIATMVAGVVGALQDPSGLPRGISKKVREYSSPTE